MIMILPSLYHFSEQSLESFGQLMKAVMRSFIVAGERDPIENAKKANGVFDRIRLKNTFSFDWYAKKCPDNYKIG